jgi:hypothetical protein
MLFNFPSKEELIHKKHRTRLYVEHKSFSIMMTGCE